ncbi:MAG: DUF1492 domain-containing protein [Eubacterium sp.]|nr:DUF1492 domain-containing protein [Eubacterium sp.]
MDAKQYLNYIRQMMLEKAMWERHLEKIDEMLITTPAIQYDSIKITSTPSKDSLEKVAIKHLERCEKIIVKINELVAELIQKQYEALKYIRKIESVDQQEVLILYYIDALSWREIADARNVDDVTAQMHLRDRAIESLQKIFDDHLMTI